MKSDQTTLIDEKMQLALRQCLQEVGLNVFSALPVRQLGGDCWLGEAPVSHGTLLLLGNGGQDFWRAFCRGRAPGEHPVDDFSARVSEQALQRLLPATERRRLFPAPDCPLLLQRAMARAGWHAPSPLGVGMHAEFGLWSACRAAWWLAAELELPAAGLPAGERRDERADHCAQCVEKPCLAACPGRALSSDRPPQLERCADYRLLDGSDCADTCLARLACPVAPEHRYSDEQLNYHYQLARSAIVHYRSGAAPRGD